MAAIRVHEFISLDGVIDTPSWTFPFGFDPRMGEAIGRITASSDGILLGRTTYEMFEPAWSSRTAEEDPGAPFFNDTSKYVVSSTLTTATWRNSEIIGGYDPKRIQQLKDESAQGLYVSGSGTLVRGSRRRPGPTGRWPGRAGCCALHEAAAGFEPAVTTYRFHPHPPLPGEVVSHGDLGPWNTVYRDGVPVAFIDWDGAEPVEPMADLAAAAWAFVPLAPPARLVQAGFDPVPDLPERLRLFVGAYGLTDRAKIVPALQRSPLASAERVRYAPVDAAGAAASLEFLAGELRWIHGISPDLARAL